MQKHERSEKITSICAFINIFRQINKYMSYLSVLIFIEIGFFVTSVFFFIDGLKFQIFTLYEKYFKNTLKIYTQAFASNDSRTPIVDVAALTLADN